MRALSTWWLMAAFIGAIICAVPDLAWAPCDPGCPIAPTGGVFLRNTLDTAYILATQFRSTDKFILGAMLGYGFPTEPLEPGKIYAKVVPGYWNARAKPETYQAGSQFSGYAIGGALLYGLNKHWGLNATYSMEQTTSGSTTPIDVFVNAVESHVTAPARAHGYIVATNVVYDPIAGEKFRLPIMVGVGYNYYSATAEATFTPPSPNTETFRYYANSKVSRFAGFIGVNPQYDAYDFRIMPFVVASDSSIFGGHGTSTVRLTNLSGGQASITGPSAEAQVSYKEVTYLAGGLGIKYMPWNLGITYSRGDLLARGTDIDFYTVTWDRRW